jgi:ABC-type bacteriocin/lantibiotic exporter with double-glycine peptidase domain
MWQAARKTQPKRGPKLHGDYGLISLAMIAAHYRIACDPGQIAHDLGLGQRAATAEDVVRAARRVGLKSRLRWGQDPAHIESVPLPAILGLKDGRFAILTHRLADGRMRLVDPVERSQALETIDAVAARWSGEIVLITRRAGGRGSIRPSSISAGSCRRCGATAVLSPTPSARPCFSSCSPSSRPCSSR